LLGFIVSGLGYIAFFKALSYLPAGKAALLFFFKPPVAILLAFLLLREAPSIPAILGSLLIMGGIFFELSPKPQQEPTPEEAFSGQPGEK
jgi:drug/metabolite transporter (DMT)-like permease